MTSESPKPKRIPNVPKWTHGISDLLAKEDEIKAAYRAKAAQDFMTFIRGLVIAGQGGPRLFESVMALFQRKCFLELAPNLTDLANGDLPKLRRFWIERTKKAAKDSDIGALLLWMIGFPRRPLYIQVGAANKEQASIVKQRMSHLLHWNEWLNDHVEIVQWEVRSRRKMVDGSPMAKLHIMSSDIAGAHGGTPDLLVINELSHVQKWEFVENLMDNADGVARGIVIIATNAGFKGTTAEVWRNNALSNENWSVHKWAKPAPWHDKETVEDAKRRNTKGRFLRLWKGKWTSGKGDALDEDDIDRVFCLPGPTLQPEPGWKYIAGLDLGISHDHSGLAVVGVNVHEQLIKVVFWKAWEPSPKTGEVDLVDVENACRIAHQNYRLSGFWYDPHQAKYMAQRLVKSGLPMIEMTFSNSSNLTKMAVCLIQAVESGKFQCYDDADGRLRRDFGKFNIVEKVYGYKLEATSDQFGHADVGTAVTICLPAAIEMLEGFRSLQPDDVLVEVESVDLTDDEVGDLPEDLRQIYNLEADDFGRPTKRESIYDPLADLE